MTFYKVGCSAVIAVALFGGCRREETATVPPPAAPPAAQQPAEAPPTAGAPATGTTPGTPDANRTVGQTVDDATVTARVKAALLQADDVKGLAIDVDTVQGTVRLTGNVQNPAQSQRAEQIARSAEGVQRVENQLTVKPTS